MGFQDTSNGQKGGCKSERGHSKKGGFCGQIACGILFLRILAKLVYVLAIVLW